MRSTFNVLFFVKKNAEKKDGTAPIVARITINKKVSQFNTKQYIKPDDWNVELNRAKGRSAEARAINTVLDEIKNSLYNAYNDLTKKVKNTFLGIGVEQYLLLELFEECNILLQKQIGITKSKATYQKAEVCKRHLSNYLKTEYKRTDIDLREINHSFIVGFETFLNVQCGCNANTTAKFIQKFKSIVLTAQKNGWIQTDPFANYRITIKKVDRGYLNDDELKRIMQKSFSSERLERIRDIFIFSCYTGLAYIDIKNLRLEHITKGFDDNLWINTKRQKTSIKTVVPLLDIAQLILDKYKGLPNGVLLPIPTNQKTNAYLKEIADVCDINKNLTFHLARHTFATTVTLSKGVTIESVSKMLGHTNIKTTQIYARITDEKISSDMQLLSEKLKCSGMSLV
ncbi:site-specific integrase [Saccharicrinis fermentans]|uniref:Tyrosine recombinase XerD n=1 Tax=Saccharicrinis fermentans DSM 9555 = JCM 21142 TaxID=869213 RepID=W7Y6R2_9BACT|nr:site-specific integrase [Saccharicrinis fermentans]GAF03937.1 tyrosine recombinase XerD [Saccharicrinis fermentans DSM 9555 = JCM 21142]